MKPIGFHPHAEQELGHSFEFYNQRVPGLGDEFVSVVKACVARIQTDPARRPLRRDGTQKIKLPRFPYLLIYREEPVQIVIVAVAHGARRPGYWSGRL